MLDMIHSIGYYLNCIEVGIEKFCFSGELLKKQSVNGLHVSQHVHQKSTWHTQSSFFLKNYESFLGNLFYMGQISPSILCIQKIICLFPVVQPQYVPKRDSIVSANQWLIYSKSTKIWFHWTLGPTCPTIISVTPSKSLL